MNIVVLSIGRSGSTIAARMLGALGWHLADADREYAESVRFRRLNERLWRRGGSLRPAEAAALLQTLPEPWALKDPRLALTWRQWQPWLDRGALLLYLTRDLAAVETSLRRRGWGEPSPAGYRLRGLTLAETQTECRRCYDAWQGPRCTIAYEDLHRAVSLFDTSRGVPA